MFFTTVAYIQLINMQTIVIVAGFVVLLALLLYFLYQQRELEEEIEPMTLERAEPDVIKAKEWDEEVEEMRKKEETKPEEPEPTETVPEEIEEEVGEELEELEGIGPTYQRLLRAAEINSISALAKQEPENLLEKMNEINEREEITKRPPRIENVEDWVEKAKSKTS